MNIQTITSSLEKHKKIIRWSVGLAIIIIIFAQVSLDDLADVFSQLLWGAVIANLVIKIVLRVTIAYKWFLILKIKDAAVLFRHVLAASLAGTAAGTLLPIFGADFTVVYAYYKQSGQADSAISSILVDRLIAVYIMVLMASLITLVNLDRFLNTPAILGLVMFALAACLALPPVFYIVQRFPRLVPHWIGTRIRNLIKRILANMKYYWQHGTDQLLLNGLISLFTQLLRILSVYTLALAVGAPGSLVDYAVVAPLMFLIMMVPIPAASVGLEQGVFVVMLGFLGVSLELAFAMALINRILMMISLTPGILCIIMGWGFEPSAAMAQTKNAKA
jgi:uncharacterized protein (TIRG00374 family)